MGIDYSTKLVCGCMVTPEALRARFPDEASYDAAEKFADTYGCAFTHGGGEFTDEDDYYVFHVINSSVKNDGSAGITGVRDPAETMALAYLVGSLEREGIPFKGPGFFAVLSAY